MKIKVQKFIIPILGAILFFSPIVSCSEEKHIHCFDKSIASEKFLASEATCEESAKYFYSCSCGEKSTEVFVSGNRLGHSYSTYVPDGNATCTQDGTKTKTCNRCGNKETINDENSKINHTFDKEITSAEYFASAATCVLPEKYYYSCVCGEKGTSTFDHGSALNHSFTNYINNNDETCVHDGSKTAKCDRCDATDTISIDGSKLEHTFNKKVADQKYLKSEATCLSPAIYYYSCECGQIGSETFECGNPLGHSFTNYVYNQDAECGIDGTETAKCDRCPQKDTRIAQNTALAHDFEIKETKLITKLEKEYTCKNCNYSYKETVNAHFHEMDDLIDNSIYIPIDYVDTVNGNQLIDAYKNNICFFTVITNTGNKSLTYNPARSKYVLSGEQKISQIYVLDTNYNYLHTFKSVIRVLDSKTGFYDSNTDTFISLEGQIGEILYHDFDLTETIKEPSKTEFGIKKYTCSSCGAIHYSILSKNIIGENSYPVYFDDSLISLENIDSLTPTNIIDYSNNNLDLRNEDYLPLEYLDIDGTIFETDYIANNNSSVLVEYSTINDNQDNLESPVNLENYNSSEIIFSLSENITISKDDKILLKQDNQATSLYINSISIKGVSSTLSLNNNEESLKFGALDENNFRIYSLEIYENGTLVRKYIPVIRRVDSKIGFYEVLNGTFSSGTNGTNKASDTYNFTREEVKDYHPYAIHELFDDDKKVSTYYISGNCEFIDLNHCCDERLILEDNCTSKISAIDKSELISTSALSVSFDYNNDFIIYSCTSCKKTYKVEMNLNIDDSKYERIEYIESTGNEFIDTCFKTNNGFIAAYDYVQDFTTLNTNLVGSYNYKGELYANLMYAPDGYFRIMKGDKSYYCDYDDIASKRNSIMYSTRDNVYATINGELLISETNTQPTTGSRLYIFSDEYDIAHEKSTLPGRLYYLVIFNEFGNLSREYVPVRIKGTNVCGLYDTKNQKFYGSASLQDFTYEHGIFENHEYYVSDIVLSTTTTEGFVEYTCAVCGEKMETNLREANRNYEVLDYIEAQDYEYLDTEFYPEGGYVISYGINYEYEYNNTTTAGVHYLRLDDDLNGEVYDEYNFRIRTLNDDFNGAYYDPITNTHVLGKEHRYKATDSYKNIAGKKVDITVSTETHGYVNIDGETILICDYLESTHVSNVTLFGSFAATTLNENSTKAKLYYCLIFDEDGELIRAYIPAKNSEGVIGMLELVYNSFYVSTGYSEFKDHNEKTDPSALQDVDTIYSSYDDSINTNISPSSKYKIEMDINIQNLNKDQVIWSTRSPNGNDEISAYYYTDKGIVFLLGDQEYIYEIVNGGRIHIVYDDYKVYINDVLKHSFTKKYFTSSKPIKLLNNYLYSAYEIIPANTRSFVYSFKIYDEKDNLIFNLLPKRRIADKVEGFYDTISQKFYEINDFKKGNYSDDIWFNSNTSIDAQTALFTADLITELYFTDGKDNLLPKALGFTTTLHRFGVHKNGMDTGTFSLYEKTVFDGTNIYNAYVVVINGTSATEWESNVNVGDSALHQGFYLGARYVYNWIKDYINSDDIEHNKIIITGHSRGSALAAILSELIQDESGLFLKENVYTYVYACPRYSTRNVTYNNIFIFNNPGDLVTFVPFPSWGYHYEGVVITLPTSSNIVDKMNSFLIKKYNQDIYRLWRGCYVSNNMKTYLPFYSGYTGLYNLDYLVGLLQQIFPTKNSTLDSGGTSAVITVLKYFVGESNADFNLLGALLTIGKRDSNYKKTVDLVSYCSEYNTRIFEGHYPQVYTAWIHAMYE